MDPTLTTPRLILDPLAPEHADKMVEILGDDRLYSFTGGQPPTLDELRATYERLALGHSADWTEEWRNWIVCLRDDAAAESPVAGTTIGTVQATITHNGLSADIAWVIGVPWQGHGYASEAASALVAWLDERGVTSIAAHIHPDHLASTAVARHAGLEPTDEIDADGERIWRSVRPGAA